LARTFFVETPGNGLQAMKRRAFHPFPARRAIPNWRTAQSLSPHAGRGKTNAFSRRISRPSFAHHHEDSLRPQKKRERSAERRMLQEPRVRGAAAQLAIAAPAFRRSTTALATGYDPDGSASEPRFPTPARQVFCLLSPLAAVKHAPCRPVLLPVER
jgi:hypothetical protein